MAFKRGASRFRVHSCSLLRNQNRQQGFLLNYWVFGPCTSSGILKRTHSFRNLTCFHPQVKTWKCTVFGQLERAIVYHRTTGPHFHLRTKSNLVSETLCSLQDNRNPETQKFQLQFTIVRTL